MPRARRPHGEIARRALVVGQCTPHSSTPASTPALASKGRRRSLRAELATVRGAGERQLGVGEASSAAPLCHQRQRLQQLDRRAREDRPVDVADRGEHAAVGVEDRHRADVPRLDRGPAQDLDEQRVSSTPSSASCASSGEL